MISATIVTTAACGSGGSARAESDRTGAATSAAAPESVSPAELRAAVSDEKARRFYESRGWRPAWTGDGAALLSSALDGAERHGLHRSMFLEAESETGTAAQREAALTRAAIAYAEALATGRTDPAKVRDLYTIARPEADAVPGLAKAVEAGNLAEWLNGLAPRGAGYRALSEAYVDYRRRAAREQGRSVASGAILREGDSDPRVPRIVQALRADGYLAPRQAATSNRYTAEIAAAVKRAQEDFGIASDGVLGPDTLEVLNAGSSERARKLAINLERLRWLEREPPATRIDVNTAAALLDFWRDGSHVDRRRVIVGQPGWETPQLGSPIFRLVANPTWTVPKSIEREEIAPKGEAYLRRNDMVRRDGWIVQLPGPDNALGEVKFDMRNRHAIYLHDTPSKHLFQKSERHRSHGCVRVEDALGFARMLAEADGKLERFEEAMATGEETFVDLDRNIPVRLVYQTAFAGRDGRVQFRADPYGWVEDVAKALGLYARERRSAGRHADADVGP
jgi:murein L,D-transpeptidase YcbB/YkuD